MSCVIADRSKNDGAGEYFGTVEYLAYPKRFAMCSSLSFRYQ